MPATTLTYTVANSAVVNRETQVTVGDQVGTFTVSRLHVELVPANDMGGTLTLDLDPATEGYDLGTQVEVTIAPMA
jgi:hypothetical protein